MYVICYCSIRPHRTFVDLSPRCLVRPVPPPNSGAVALHRASLQLVAALHLAIVAIRSGLVFRLLARSALVVSIFGHWFLPNGRIARSAPDERAEHRRNDALVGLDIGAADAERPAGTDHPAARDEPPPRRRSEQIDLELDAPDLGTGGHE